jgi:hypothetical protein
MDRFARVVLGYHGCEPTFAEALIRGELPIDEWQPSQNPYDWLGHGIYFWECAPHRVKSWSGKDGVVGAVIQLGLCLDLTDVKYTKMLGDEYQRVRRVLRARQAAMPRNRAGRRDLDCLIVNELAETAAKDGLVFQTVRCPFLEGRKAFPGSGIRRESHVQIAVRDKSCILGVFRPSLT